MTTITNTHLTTPNIGLFEIPRRVSRPAEQFEAQLKNAQLAEDLGMHSYWAAQAHFSAIGLPSSLSVLSAVSQRTQHIRLGTAVITLAFENPIRLAETASVVNTLAHNRLELGVGKGNPRGRASAAYRAFGASEAQRGTLFEQQLQSLRQAFNHVEKDADGDEWKLYPEPNGLDRRIWQATSSVSTAVAAGRAGDGLQLHSVGPEPLGEIQLELVEAYREALPEHISPRIAVARTVIPDVATPEELAMHSLANPKIDTHVITGSAVDISKHLLADPTVQASTDLLFRIPLGIETTTYREALRALALEVAPLLSEPSSPSNRAQQRLSRPLS